MDSRQVMSREVLEIGSSKSEKLLRPYLASLNYGQKLSLEQLDFILILNSILPNLSEINYNLI